MSTGFAPVLSTEYGIWSDPGVVRVNAGADGRISIPASGAVELEQAAANRAAIKVDAGDGRMQNMRRALV